MKSQSESIRGIEETVIALIACKNREREREVVESHLKRECARVACVGKCVRVIVCSVPVRLCTDGLCRMVIT